MNIQNKEAHGKDKNSTSGRDARRDKSPSDGLGGIRGDCFNDGNEQIRTFEENHQGRDPYWQHFKDGTPDLKKILERLEALEERHIAYVRAHKSRLQARLDEDIVEEEQFLEESSQLKNEIYVLAVSRQ